MTIIITRLPNITYPSCMPLAVLLYTRHQQAPATYFEMGGLATRRRGHVCVRQVWTSTTRGLNIFGVINGPLIPISYPPLSSMALAYALASIAIHLDRTGTSQQISRLQRL